jgi:GST-like protein
VFIPANLYPLITIIDFPGRFLAIPPDAPVKQEEVEKWLLQGTKRKRVEVWRLIEEHLGNSKLKGDSPFLLGTSNPTILDVVIALVAHWGPSLLLDETERYE